MKNSISNFLRRFHIIGKLNRKDFGLTWNAATETGGVLVSDEIRIIAEIQLLKQAVAEEIELTEQL